MTRQPLLQKPAWAVLLLTLSLLPIFALSFYNYPYVDDFTNAHNRITNGFLGSQLELYKTWTGRLFSSLLITSANPLAFDSLLGIKLMPILILLLTATTIHGGLQLLFDQPLKLRLVWTALLLLLYVQLIPDSFSGIYWFSSAYVYTIGQVSLTGALVAAGRGLCSGTAVGRGLWFGLALLLTVATATSNEIVLIYLLSGLALLSVMAHYQHRLAARNWWVALLLVALVAGIISLAAPGNFTRLVHKSTSPESLEHKLLVVLPRVVLTMLRFLANARLLATLLVVWLLVRHWTLRANYAALRLPLWRGLAWILVTVAASHAFLILVMGAALLPRAQNTMLYFVLMAWIVVLVTAPNDTTGKHIHRQFEELIFRHSAAIFWGLVIILCITGAPRRAWQEWLINGNDYNRQMRHRYALINQAKKRGQAEVTVPPIMHLKPYQVLITGGDLAVWSGYWNNKFMAIYFGLSAISVDESLLPQAHTDFGGSWTTGQPTGPKAAPGR